jgi:hypothetical protein
VSWAAIVSGVGLGIVKRLSANQDTAPASGASANSASGLAGANARGQQLAGGGGGRQQNLARVPQYASASRVIIL